MSIVDKIKDITSKDIYTDNDIEYFEASIDCFESMVEAGVAKKRGYNLQTIDNSVSYNIVPLKV